MAKQKRKRLRVETKGFACIYVLGILQLVVVFSLMLITSSASISVSKREDSIHMAQLFAIYRVKERLSNVEIVQPEDSQEKNTEIDEVQEALNQEEQWHFTIEQEQIEYYGHHIDIQYESELVQVSIDHLQFTLHCDLKERIILDLVYH